MAFGRLRLTPKEFGLMTAPELYYMLAGHNEAQSDMIDQLNFQVRRVCYFSIACHLDKSSEIKNETDLWPHKWDDALEEQRRASLPIAKVIFEK